jgi:hypothetical protein
VKATKDSSGIQAPCQKADISQQGASGSFKKPGAAEESTGGKDLLVVMSQGASNSGISP